MLVSNEVTINMKTSKKKGEITYLGKGKIMVQITLATSAERKSILAETSTTLKEIINNNHIDTTGATIMLKGNVVSAFDLDRTLAQCGVEDGSSVIMNVAVKAAAAMEVKLENNVLTIVTDVTEASIKKGLSNMKACDEDGNEVYAVGVSKSGDAKITGFSFTGNTYVNGKLAATMVLPMDKASIDKVQKAFGEMLLAAKKYTAQIAQEAAEKEAEIEALFN